MLLLLLLTQMCCAFNNNFEYIIWPLLLHGNNMFQAKPAYVASIYKNVKRKLWIKVWRNFFCCPKNGSSEIFPTTSGNFERIFKTNGSICQRYAIAKVWRRKKKNCIKVRKKFDWKWKKINIFLNQIRYKYKIQLLDLKIV